LQAANVIGGCRFLVMKEYAQLLLGKEVKLKSHYGYMPECTLD